MAERRALVVGIDKYSTGQEESEANLLAAAAEAEEIGALLARDDDGRERWDVTTLTDVDEPILKDRLQSAIDSFFSATADEGKGDLLFYFAGHAVDLGGDVRLQAFDGHATTFGSLMSLLHVPIDRGSRVTIILDTCMSGAVGNVSRWLDKQMAVVPEGVTLMTASRPAQRSNELVQRGQASSVFSAQLIGGLRGAAADLLGNISALSLYAHASIGMRADLSRVGGVRQEPMFKCHTDQPVILRRSTPRASPQSLMALPTLFGDGADKPFRLTSHHEGKAEWRNDTAYLTDPQDPDFGANDRRDLNRKAFTGSKAQVEMDHLKQLRNGGLLETPGDRDLFWLATEAPEDLQWARLTSLGRYYWSLAKSGLLAEELLR